MVGAGRFERPTPCAQGMGVVSNSPSFTSRFQCFQPDRESAFRSKANPSSVNRSSFGTVLPQFGRCVANRELTRGSTLCITKHNTRRTSSASRVWSAPVMCCGCSTRRWSSPNGNSDRRDSNGPAEARKRSAESGILFETVCSLYY